MNFEEILTAMTLDATDKPYLTIFTLTVLEGMQSKIHDYPDFKAFFEATIEYSKSIGQPIDFTKLRLIRESEPKKAKAPKKADYKAKEQFIDADLGIMPSIDLSNEDNIKQWEIYEMSAQYWAQQSDKHRNILRKRKEKYMLDLGKHTAENLDRWRKRAKEMRELYPYTKEGIQDLANLFGIKPESTTSNETHPKQPNTQEKEKDSTVTNVVRSFEDVKNTAKTYEYYLEKYKDDHESLIAIESIKDHLPQRQKEVSNTEQIKAWLTDYNVFEEEELDW